MNASELRIGNYVTIDNPRGWPGMKGKPLRVTGSELSTDFPSSTGTVRLEGYGVHPEFNQFDEFIQPIPLTEEWLVKFGFGKSDECERGYNTHKHFGFYYDWHFKQFKLEVDDGANVVDIPMQIHYVHQLQNLYFALTGEELTLKEK